MTVLYVVTVEVEPGSADSWNTWHSDHHVPDVLREPGFIACRKWRDTQPSPDGWVRYVVQFELESLDAYQRYTTSDAASRLRADSLEHFGKVTRYQRAVLEEVRLKSTR